MNRLALRKRRSVDRLTAAFDDWNADPNGGAYTGYDALEAQMRAGEHMAENVCVEPRTPVQRRAYHRLQNLAPALGYERRPPAGIGLSFLHIHFERSSVAGDSDGGME